mmetsp:Transcript_7928/g.14295  ORF Transcript_7928/g.14295 Transcript_7928/m.14295 type:complete len:141 (-) Transcript_7928:1331-1753(-)
MKRQPVTNNYCYSTTQYPGLRSLVDPQATLVSNVLVKLSSPCTFFPTTTLRPPPTPPSSCATGTLNRTRIVRITLPQLLLYSPMNIRALDNIIISAMLAIFRWYRPKQLSVASISAFLSLDARMGTSPLRWKELSSVGLK